MYDKLTVLRRAEDDNFFISISTEYAVSVGVEGRTFVVYECIYPVAVTVQEFVSVAPLAKPQYPQILKKLPDQRWVLWDMAVHRKSTTASRL